LRYNPSFMPVTVQSFGKINLGLRIGARRADGYHELRTVYQTISLHDTIRVDVQRGAGIELRCKDARVPLDESNTCWRVAERVLKAAKSRGKVVIALEKRLPVQGGIGAASSNAVATLLGLERALDVELEPEERLRIAAEVGSDLALFLVGGTVLGIGRGEEVFPLADLPPLDIVIATPVTGVSTPEAFADWDKFVCAGDSADAGLTPTGSSATIDVFSRSVFAWLTANLPRAIPGASTARAGNAEAAGTTAGVPTVRKSLRPVRTGAARRSGDRVGRTESPARTLREAFPPLSDLVRAGIENDFERVVFPKYPELREVKRELERAGARYASLSGSGSAIYGLFESADAAQAAAARVNESGTPALAAKTLTRDQYWAELFDF
jgi:4-diphosphocytidyl-2-C-methyl-D-erythritol kinase